MAYFPDMSPYGYIESPFTEQPDAINIGWLAKERPFPVGEAPAGFVEQLRQLRREPVNVCRGWHTCEFCGQASGNGELRVARHGVTYAAPVLVDHYVSAHHYLPPPEFVLAVLESRPDADAGGLAPAPPAQE